MGKGFVEVKGVTLEQDGIALFPDAPTQRGLRHLEELIDCKKAGYLAGILFVVQMEDCRVFCPNWKAQETFETALCKARDTGVQIQAVSCQVRSDYLEIEKSLPVELPSYR